VKPSGRRQRDSGPMDVPRCPQTYQQSLRRQYPKPLRVDFAATMTSDTSTAGLHRRNHTAPTVHTHSTLGRPSVPPQENLGGQPTQTVQSASRWPLDARESRTRPGIGDRRNPPRNTNPNRRLQIVPLSSPADRNRCQVHLLPEPQLVVMRLQQKATAHSTAATSRGSPKILTEFAHWRRSPH
jgi:hypothetical protein